MLGFGDDGKTVYIYARVQQVNVWRVLVYHWPEAVGGIVALLTLRWMVRVARRPQVPGEEHCRCCNYLLKGLTSGRCPECGTYLTAQNRLAGRRRWPRVLGALVILLIGTGAYFWAGARLPRQGRVSEWFDWRSMSIAEWAEAGGRTWVTRHVRGDAVVLLADVEHGRVRRTVCRVQVAKDESSPGPAVLSADRQFLFCRTGNDSNVGVAQVELASGKVVRKFKGMGGQLRVSAEGPARTLFSEVREFMCGWHVLSTVNVQSGRPLSELSINAFDSADVLTSANRDFVVITGSVPGEENAVDVRVWDPLSGAITKSFKVSGFPAGCDRGKLYVSLFQHDVLEIETWDVLAAKRVDTIELDPVGNRALIVTNGTLIATELPRAGTLMVLAVNLKTRARRSWIMDRVGSVSVSPDGRHAFVTFSYCFGDSGEVRIYDIPEK